jgi:8-oxo-dGTP pyrophosphatase MutT (NUDIX family)
MNLFGTRLESSVARAIIGDAGERAGVIVIRKGRVALIERHSRGRRYWAIPGGRVKSGETITDAARREAEEELGVPVDLGTLRVRIDHREEDGSVQHQWYFEATVQSEGIQVVGPEIESSVRGTYRAVWIGLDVLDTDATYPLAVARLIVERHGEWPRHVIEIVESLKRATDPSKN